MGSNQTRSLQNIRVQNADIDWKKRPKAAGRAAPKWCDAFLNSARWHITQHSLSSVVRLANEADFLAATPTIIFLKNLDGMGSYPSDDRCVGLSASQNALVSERYFGLRLTLPTYVGK